jgi:nucleotide-binding universal stress UspA family protein
MEQDEHPGVEDVCRVAEVRGGVLVGHDGSSGGLAALRWAAALCVRDDLELHVLRAWKVTSAPQPARWRPGVVPPLPEWERAVREELARDIAAAELDPRLELGCHVAYGDAAPCLIASAEDTEMLVVGSRGRGGFAGLLLGSVSDQCVRHAPCPVTVVKAPDRRSMAHQAFVKRDMDWRGAGGYVVS